MTTIWSCTFGTPTTWPCWTTRFGWRTPPRLTGCTASSLWPPTPPCPTSISESHKPSHRQTRRHPEEASSSPLTLWCQTTKVMFLEWPPSIDSFINLGRGSLFKLSKFPDKIRQAYFFTDFPAPTETGISETLSLGEKFLSLAKKNPWV